MKAFPYKSLSGQEWDNGMDLRDYFAAKAMQAFIEKYSQAGDVSRHAYIVADAMMKAREV